jgi:iron complex transport system substrate-binding protein
MAAGAAPARPGVVPTRIVSLSPHITELFFAVGAGDELIGVDAWSDYPPPARSIERVGDVFAIDIERLLALKPDLVVYWKSGTPMRQQEQLGKLGLNLLGTEQRRLADIETALQQFGDLSGHGAQGREAAASFRAQRLALVARYAQRPRLRVFYQVWDRPLYTLTGEHVVNEVLDLCGGSNVFAGLSGLAPVVDMEAVLARDPDVIIVAAGGAEATRQMQAWQRFPGLTAVRSKHIYAIAPDLLNRMAPRILQGVETLCRTLDQARRRAGDGVEALPSARRNTSLK